MGLLDRAKRDIKKITSNKSKGWAAEIVFLAPNGETATINGLHTKHHLGVDPEGNAVNSKNAHISFAEETLTDENENYPVRNVNGDVDLKSHKITVADSTGNLFTYVVDENFPNETTGLIVCTLKNFDA